MSLGALTLSISSPSCGNISHIINVVFVFHMIYLMSLLSSHSFPLPFPTISFNKLHSSNRHYSDDLQSNVVVLHSKLSTPIISTTPISPLQYRNHTHFNDLQSREELLSLAPPEPCQNLTSHHPPSSHSLLCISYTPHINFVSSYFIPL